MKGEIVSFEKAADRCCNVLPGDLIVKILQRLPVKSLLRFESVSKDWLFLILHPQFIAKHLLHNQQKAATKINYLHRYHHDPHCRNDISKIFLCRASARTDCCPKEHHQCGISLISKRDNDQNGNPFSTRVLAHDHYIRKDISIVGSSNGMVCLKFNNNLFFGIWNPATRKFKFLPNPSSSVLDRELGHISFGFSYVPNTACYKLVRISALREAKDGNNNGECVTRVQVLDIGQDCWREVLCHGQNESYDHFDMPFYLYTSPVVVNGCLHWIGSTHTESSRSMVTFDLEKEVFIVQTTLPYPFDDNSNFCKLTIFEENLAAFVSPRSGLIWDEDEESKALSMFPQVWIYERANQTWKKRFTFGPLQIRDNPIGFWGDEEIIIQSNGRNAYLYNPYSKQKTKYSPCREIECNVTFYPYVESLIQI